MFDWTNPKDLDSLINKDAVTEILENQDNPANRRALEIINKMPLPTEVIISDDDDDNE